MLHRSRTLTDTKELDQGLYSCILDTEFLPENLTWQKKNLNILIKICADVSDNDIPTGESGSTTKNAQRYTNQDELNENE